MLIAHPTVLRTLVERYEALRAKAGDGDLAGEGGQDGMNPRLRQQLVDTAYTLCVSTGTREIGPALAVARAHIERFARGERGAVDGTAA
jgi:hypothetical protein